MNIENVNKAVEAGDVKAVQDKVSISEKASPTGKAAEMAYTRYVAVTARGMAALCDGKLEPAKDKPETGDDTRTDAEKAPGACDYFNYGFDLDVRATVRAKLMSTLEGPEKAIKKAIDTLVNNAGFSETDARALVIAQRTKAGLPV
jgi:hypothetical protein